MFISRLNLIEGIIPQIHLQRSSSFTRILFRGRFCLSFKFWVNVIYITCFVITIPNVSKCNQFKIIGDEVLHLDQSLSS